MGFGLAIISKAVMARKALKALPKFVKAYACKSCSSLALVKVYPDRIEVAKCQC